MHNYVQLKTVLRRAVTCRHANNFNRHHRLPRQFLNLNLHNSNKQPSTSRRRAFRARLTMFSFNSILRLTRANSVLRLITNLTLLPFLINILVPTNHTLTIIRRRFKLPNRRAFENGIIITTISINMLNIINRIHLI